MGDPNRNGRVVESHSLYATNLPQELDENGIRNVFNKFGTVTGIIVSVDLKFAFISYATYAEAEAAIAGLDEKPPLELRVEFRKKKIRENGSSANNPAQNNQEPSILSTPTKIIEATDHRYDRFPRRLESRPGVPLRLPPPEMSSYYYNYPKDRVLHPSVYDYYDNIQYPETNALWSRGHIMVDAARQRHVSLGRGYTHYHIPEPFPGVENQLNRFYEQRTSESYVYGKDDLNNLVGKCLACSKNALYNCKSCEGSYCSRECQVADWPKHKSQCIIPPLVTTSKIESDKTNDITSKPALNKNFASTNDKLLPKTFKSITKEASTEKPKKVDLASRLEISRKSVQVEDKDFEFERNENSFLSPVDFVPVQIVAVHKHGLLSVQKTSDINNLTDLMTKLTKMSENLEKIQHPISGKIYAAVYDTIWHRVVILDSSPLKIDYIDYGTVEEITDAIDLREIGELANIPRFSRIIRIRPQLLEKYKNLMETKTIQVRMIDVGNDGIINVDVFDHGINTESNVVVFKDRPKKLVHIDTMPKPLKLPKTNVAANIIENKIEKSELSPAKKTEINESSAKKMESSPTKRIEKSESSPAKNIEKTIKNLPNILEILKKGVSQVIAEIVEKIDENSVLAAILFDEVKNNYSQVMEPLKNDCDALKSQYLDFKPEVNDLICAFMSLDGYWRRARVLSTSPTLKIASLDEGLTFDAETVIPIPPKYLQIHSFVVILSTEAKVKFPEVSLVTFKVLEKKISEGSESELVLNGELLDAGIGMKIQIKNWSPITEVSEKLKSKEEPNEKLLAISKIENGSKVVIQSFRSTSILYIRSLDNQEVERYCRVIQDTAKAAQISINLKTNPEVGDLVLAQFIDDNYYRAIVLEVEDPKIKINYIDFGNNEVKTLKKLKMMPTEIKKEPHCAKKIILKGIKDVPPTEEAIAYLKKISDQDTPFIYTYEDSFNNDVILTDLDGKIVNEMINTLLVPDWKKKETKNDEDYLKLEDMEIGELGKIGETVKAYCLAPIEPGFKYIFASMNAELITHISNVLPGLLMDYCTKSEFYIPRVNELCIAKYDTEWCRGCCIIPSLTPTSSEIYFLDYGNIGEVKHVDIRMMQKDFLKPSALGLVCNILDFVPDNKKLSKELLEKLNSILIPNEIYSLQILKYEDAEWTVELLEVKEKLIQEGLITS